MLFKYFLLDENDMKSQYKNIIYGGIDGLITTFSIVSASLGAGLSNKIVLIMGLSNVVSDGFSMASSSYMSYKTHNEIEHDNEDYVKNAIITFISFVLLGIIPLLPFFISNFKTGKITNNEILYSYLLASILFFGLGYYKNIMADKNKFTGGFEVLTIGMIGSIISYMLARMIEYNKFVF